MEASIEWMTSQEMHGYGTTEDVSLALIIER